MQDRVEQDISVEGQPYESERSIAVLAEEVLADKYCISWGISEVRQNLEWS